MKRLVGTVLVWALLFVGCTPTSLPTLSAAEPEWILETPEVKATFWEDQGVGKLTLTNLSAEDLEAPSLAWYNPESQQVEAVSLEPIESILTGQTVTKAVSFPQALSSSSYVQLNLGEQVVGGFYAASAAPDLFPAWTFSSSPLTQRPTSGIWSFELSGSGSNLSGSCAGLAGGFSSQGQVSLEVATNGFMARLNADGHDVLFNRASLDTPEYVSLGDTFEVPHQDEIAVGTVVYEFTATSPDIISGTLSWDNSLGCTGTYPFIMSLLSPAGWELFIPQAGFWTITYGVPEPCNGMSVNLGMLSGVPLGAGEMILNGGGDAPLQLQLDTPGGDMSLVQSGSSNGYISLIPNQLMGTQFDPLTNQMVVFTGTVQAWSLSQTAAFGVLFMQGNNGCSMSVPFTLAHI